MERASGVSLLLPFISGELYDALDVRLKPLPPADEKGPFPNL